MKKLSFFSSERHKGIGTALVHDKSRQRVMFIGMNLVLAFVSFVMTIINAFTAEYLLMGTTLLFSALCVLNLLLQYHKISSRIAYSLFSIEAMCLLCFFLISGIPDGFSVLWVCLVPSFALLIFGRRNGGWFCFAVLGVLIFLFWIPAGKALLQYDYSSTFLLRFPFLYMATLILSFLLDAVRGETQKQFTEEEKKSRYLYRHDALTGLYNRYAFNELIANAFESGGRAAIILMDIDNFKGVNDSYGHNAGDEVLRKLAALPEQVLCDHCRCCRWGGEEFMVLMQCEHDPLEMAEKIRACIEKAVVVYENKEISVTVSLGVCIISDTENVTISQAMKQADRCLYDSKSSGKNCVTAVTLS